MRLGPARNCGAFFVLQRVAMEKKYMVCRRQGVLPYSAPLDFQCFMNFQPWTAAVFSAGNKICNQL